MTLDWAGLRTLTRTATFRLAIVQALVFLAFAAVLLSSVYVTTAGQLNAEAEAIADQEFETLSGLYASEGLRRLNQEVIVRVARGGPGLYVLADQDGVVISGHFDALPGLPRGPESERIRFAFETTTSAGAPTRRFARGRIGRLLGGPVLLVARDMGDAKAVVARVTSAVWLGGGLGLALSLLAGLTASRQAARRAGALSRTARDVMAGDLSRRAPVVGVGDEFDTLAQDMNAMLARLERLVQSTRTAGDAIAHDLRTPLSRMRQRIEAALARPAASEADRTALEHALAECDAVLATFAAILRLSRVQSADGWALGPIDAGAIAAELAELYGPAAEEAGVDFSFEADEGLAIVGDQSLITQALANLLDNAVKFTPAGGRIALQARRAGAGQVRLAVLDDGPGVPAAARERVKERFFRLETSRTTPGAGLGLSLVAAIAELHRGAFRLSDGLGEGVRPGLCAELVLPAAPPP